MKGVGKQPTRRSPRTNKQMDSSEAPPDSPKMKKTEAVHAAGDIQSCEEAEKSLVSDDEIVNTSFGEETKHSPDSDDEVNQGSDTSGEITGTGVSGLKSKRSSVPSEPELEKDPVIVSTVETDNEVKTSQIIDEPATEISSDSGLKTKKSFFAGKINFTIISIAVGLLSILFWYCIPSSSLPQKEFSLLEIFGHELEKVQSNFPNQRHELWRRSRIHLQRHLKTHNPTEPVSLILTSGRSAEKTLLCLAQQLAAAFSTALNSSVLNIDGSSKRSQDSDQVKLDIDTELKEAFNGGTQAAVIHRFEELPPGSTLIFYRYCDHENAAYKKVFLAFTVMLDEETTFSPHINLGMVEEMVREHLNKKFISSNRTATFNQMDVDKLSGLWSRISHVILPVTAEQVMEQNGCTASQ